MRFVAIATTNYRPQLERLLRSLSRSHPQSAVDVYVDAPLAFGDLPHDGASAIHLPEIDSLGVKRAKFVMYQRALANGPFVYLDSDVVVLESLDELSGDGLTACADDLHGCSFIDDRRHPWPGDPSLENRLYVNSGVLGFGSGSTELADEMLRRVKHDDFWFRHIHERGLFDNHVLCALLNILDVDVRLVSAHEYNWQGFRHPDGTIAAIRRGASLIHEPTGRRLRLVHFAGVTDIDTYLLSAPAEIAHLVNRASVEPMSAAAAVAAVSAGAGFLCDDSRADRSVVVEETSKAFADAWNGTSVRDTGGGYLRNTTDLISVALAVPPMVTRWNGLACGGTHFEPTEYQQLRDLIRGIRPKVVVELAQPRLSSVVPDIEALWLTVAGDDYADDEQMTALRRSLSGVTAVDLLFVASVADVPKCDQALLEIIEGWAVRTVVLHNARRDAAAALSTLLPVGFRPAYVVESSRALLVLTRDGKPPFQLDPVDCQPLKEFRATICSPATRIAVPHDGEATLQVILRNDSAETWCGSGKIPVALAYHIATDDTVVLHDGCRTGLPCDVRPGDELELGMNISGHGLAAGQYVLRVCLVQEGVAWFEEVAPASTLLCRCDVT